jgi:E3 ubiquitin-protein ligase SIAH1
MDSLSKDLLLELECPVCMEYMLPPITMCANGHNICNSCKSSLDKCPSCKGKFTDIKNLSLETMCRKVKFPCKHAENGCTEVLPMDAVTKHQAECPYGLYKCPFVIASLDCSWEGFITEIEDHIRNTHVETSDARDVLGIHKARLPKFDTATAWCQALFTMNEIFFRLSRVKDGFLYCCVFYVGPKDKAPNYSYRLTIEKTEGKSCVSSYHETTGCQSDVNDVIRKGDCAVFHLEFANTCVNEENELVIEEEIFGPSMPASVHLTDN